MYLLLLVIIAGVAGFFIGRSRRSKTVEPSNQQIVDVEAKDAPQEP